MTSPTEPLLGKYLNWYLYLISHNISTPKSIPTFKQKAFTNWGGVSIRSCKKVSILKWINWKTILFWILKYTNQIIINRAVIHFWIDSYFKSEKSIDFAHKSPAVFALVFISACIIFVWSFRVYQLERLVLLISWDSSHRVRMIIRR